MRPFPPEDGLEAIERHVWIELGELRDLLVAVELGLPVRAAQRRKDSGDRLPLGDREAGFGEPRRAADQHHEKDKACDGDQPETNGPASVKARGLGDGGRGVGYGHGGCGSLCPERVGEEDKPRLLSQTCPKAQTAARGAGSLSGSGGRSELPPIELPLGRRERSLCSLRQFVGKNRIYVIGFPLSRIDLRRVSMSSGHKERE